MNALDRITAVFIVCTGLGCVSSSVSSSPRPDPSAPGTDRCHQIKVRDLIGGIVGTSVIDRVSVYHVFEIAGSLPVPFNEGEIVWDMSIETLPDGDSVPAKLFMCFFTTTRELTPKKLFTALLNLDESEHVVYGVLNLAFQESVDHGIHWSPYRHQLLQNERRNGFEIARPLWFAEAVVEITLDREKHVFRYRDAPEALDSWFTRGGDLPSDDEYQCTTCD